MLRRAPTSCRFCPPAPLPPFHAEAPRGRGPLRQRHELLVQQCGGGAAQQRHARRGRHGPAERHHLRDLDAVDAAPQGLWGVGEVDSKRCRDGDPMSSSGPGALFGSLLPLVWRGVLLAPTTRVEGTTSPSKGLGQSHATATQIYERPQGPTSCRAALPLKSAPMSSAMASSTSCEAKTTTSRFCCSIAFRRRTCPRSKAENRNRQRNRGETLPTPVFKLVHSPVSSKHESTQPELKSNMSHIPIRPPFQLTPLTNIRTEPSHQTLPFGPFGQRFRAPTLAPPSVLDIDTPFRTPFFRGDEGTPFCGARWMFAVVLEGADWHDVHLSRLEGQDRRVSVRSDKSHTERKLTFPSSKHGPLLQN